MLAFWKCCHDPGQHDVDVAVGLEKTQRALVGLGGAALAAAVALPGKGGLEFPQRDNKVYKLHNKERKKGIDSLQCGEKKIETNKFIKRSQG